MKVLKKTPALPPDTRGFDSTIPTAYSIRIGSVENSGPTLLDRVNAKEEEEESK